ncbi:MAG: adenylate/guanylate cyclase domain-containing protein [Chloroflexi bacterium]|nr:adenylate/guanylate cyclase domain-containing protein [Chloroflexota bacterium]
MQTKNIDYIYLDSFERIDEILAANDNSYTEVNEIPSRDQLTFTNGFYVNCTALMIDIRDSSSLPESHNRPTLSKLYRSYISEVVAIMNGNSKCSEISIIGDGVLGIFNTPYKSDIDSIISTSAILSSLIDVYNYKLTKKSIQNINVGIGIDYGRALMIKAGFKGSSINDVVWIGDVINNAVHLSDHGNETDLDMETMISNAIFINLNDHHKSLFTFNTNNNCYHGNIVNIAMNSWCKENCI